MDSEQFFDIFNMNLAFYNDTPSHTKAELNTGKLPECFVNGTDKKLMRLLTIPKPILPEDPLVGQTFMLSSVESEYVHILIFRYDDVFCLSITSRYMWTVGVRTLSKLYTPWILHKRGAWAGCRLIIARTYADPSGLVLTEDERDSVDEYYEEAHCRWLSATVRAICPSWTKTTRTRISSYVSVKGCFLLLYRNGWRSLSQCFRLRTRKRNEPMVLRNLTKKEYVRDDGLSLSPEYTFKRNLMTLRCALMSRIVWSSKWSVDIQMSDEFAGRFIQGVWAGCSFDIVETGELDEKLDEWKDVTREVKENLRYLVSQNPSKWKVRRS